MAEQVRVGERQIGGDAPPLIVAEAGVNHDGSVARALDLVRAAAEVGADAVKFQTFHADALARPDAAQAAYQRERAPSATQREMLRHLELPDDAWGRLSEEAAACGILFLSTPFDVRSAELLAKLGMPAFKVGSGDLTNLVLLRALAAFGRPLLVSTGMATLHEIDVSLADVRAHGDPPIVLLHCTSAYPAPMADANLRAMATLRDRYAVPVGYSDHTTGLGAAVAAAGLGAAVIEKHITMDRSLPGPDHAASLEPGEFAAMAGAARDAAMALGSEEKRPAASELDARKVARRSLAVVSALPAGHVLREEDLTALRPADGISPQRLDEVVGRQLARDVKAAATLLPEDLDPPLGG